MPLGEDESVERRSTKPSVGVIVLFIVCLGVAFVVASNRVRRWTGGRQVQPPPATVPNPPPAVEQPTFRMPAMPATQP